MTKDQAIDCAVRLDTAIAALQAAYDITRDIAEENENDNDVYLVMADIGDAHDYVKNARQILQGLINADR